MQIEHDILIHNKEKYLSSASAFFLTSADNMAGEAYLGSESCCCFFSLSQASASTHSFKTYQNRENYMIHKAQ